jgi:hypothetical protein
MDSVAIHPCAAPPPTSEGQLKSRIPDIPLLQLPSLAELFKLFLSGRHLNRANEARLWAELEQQEGAYSALFAALGYELRIDPRGFAWFHSVESSSHVGKTSRQLALLFMVIFDAQANAGRTLQRFTDWIIDSDTLAEASKQQQEVLLAEGLGPDGLAELMAKAASLGFASPEPSGWRLLPAVYRYLDHFESLMQCPAEDDEALSRDDSQTEAPAPEEAN